MGQFFQIDNSKVSDCAKIEAGMSIREKLNQNKSWGVVGAILALMIGVYVIYSQINADKLITDYYAYFTIDDGKTFFGGDINQIVPFQKNGKEAVKAHVFERDGKKFVGYLSKLNEQARIAVEKYEADSATKPKERPASFFAAQTAQATGWLYKKPGEGNWVPKKSDLQLDIKGSDGKPLDELAP